jgi:predicted metalloprotease
MEQKMGAGGDFARVYVMAHEYGHHIQTLTGLSDQVRSAQQSDQGSANQLQVAMELQADCYAGVWAGRNRDRIEPGDIEEGMTAAHAIGDDTLMRQAGRRPVEAAFTHGSAEQRMQWLRRGLETGDEDQCDTFAAFRR